MTPTLTGAPPPTTVPGSPFWVNISWISALLAVCYAPILYALAVQWTNDEDMGHGFFVPLIAAYIVWLNRSQLAGRDPRPNWWGVAVMLWGALQLYIGTLGAELFLSRTSFVISLIGAVLLLGGTEYLRKLSFPLFLLFFMVPIPAVVYNQITFPLQMLASKVAENTIDMLGIPILREGNVLILAHQRLDVVEACSGIRSLLTLTFSALVYGYFFERRAWVRTVLFFATIPIAILQNAGRVTLTGVVAQFKPDLAEGWFHEAQGFMTFIIGLAIMVLLHQAIIRTYRLLGGRK